MLDLSWLDRAYRSLHQSKQRPIKFDFVLLYVDDYDAKAENCKVVFVLKSPVSRHQNVELAL